MNSMEIKIPKRMSTAIINSLTAGVVPRVGLEYIAVGRKNEIAAILQDLENIADGAAAFRFVVGRYGSGKSFLLQIIRNYAMDRDFVVADADLSPEKRLTGSHNQGLATYRELMQRLSTKLRPDGGALEAILQKWINGVKTEVIGSGVSPTDEKLNALVESKIVTTITAMQGMAHGFDFAAVVSAYYKAFAVGDDMLKAAAIKWLRGEFATKTEAKSVLPVGEIISDENWYEYIKLFACFLAQIGYKGLVIFIDECVNLYKISNRQSRENNYEKLLSLFNDTMQGKAEHLGLYFAGTPQFVEDERRGLYSYEALKSRLSESRFAQEGFVDWGGPIIRLHQLSEEEVYLLLEKITAIHASHFGYAPGVTQPQIVSFMQMALSGLGADQLLTPREVTRDYISLLNLMMQDPNLSFESLIESQGFAVHPSTEDPDAATGDEYAAFEL